MDHLTWFTEFETGEDVCVDISRATLIERLDAEHEDDWECGARTKIVIDGQIVLVNETPRQIRNCSASPAPQRSE